MRRTELVSAADTVGRHKSARSISMVAKINPVSVALGTSLRATGSLMSCHEFSMVSETERGLKATRTSIRKTRKHAKTCSSSSLAIRFSAYISCCKMRPGFVYHRVDAKNTLVSSRLVRLYHCMLLSYYGVHEEARHAQTLRDRLSIWARHAIALPQLTSMVSVYCFPPVSYV